MNLFEFIDPLFSHLIRLPLSDLFSLSLTCKLGNSLAQELFKETKIIIRDPFILQKIPTNILCSFKHLNIHINVSMWDYYDMKNIKRINVEKYFIKRFPGNTYNLNIIANAKEYEFHNSLLSKDILRCIQHAKTYKFIKCHLDLDGIKYLKGAKKYKFENCNIDDNSLKYLSGAQSYYLCSCYAIRGNGLCNISGATSYTLSHLYNLHYYSSLSYLSNAKKYKFINIVIPSHLFEYFANAETYIFWHCNITGNVLKYLSNAKTYKFINCESMINDDLVYIKGAQKYSFCNMSNITGNGLKIHNIQTNTIEKQII